MYNLLPSILIFRRYLRDRVIACVCVCLTEICMGQRFLSPRRVCSPTYSVHTLAYRGAKMQDLKYEGATPPFPRALPTYYSAMHFSAKRGIAIACRLSVCDVGEL